MHARKKLLILLSILIAAVLTIIAIDKWNGNTVRLQREEFCLLDSDVDALVGYELLYGNRDSSWYKEVVPDILVDIHYNDHYILCTSEQKDSLEYYVISVPEFLTNKEDQTTPFTKDPETGKLVRVGRWGPFSRDEYYSKIDSLGIDTCRMTSHPLYRF